MKLLSAPTIALALLVHTPAGASPMGDRASVADSMAVPAASPRSYAKDWMVAPSGTYVAGGRLRFITADDTPFGDSASMTDLALFDLFARASLGDRLELTLGLSTLAKEPSMADESILQGGFGSLRVGLGDHAAVDFTGNARPLLGNTGWAVSPGVSVSLRKTLDRFLRFQGGLGVSWLNIMPDEGDSSSFTEAGLQGQIVFPMGGNAGAWLGADYRVPITDVAGPMPLDPEPRLGVHAGWAFTFVPEWNLYAEYSILDRGDLAAPETTLPVLDGGFDQSQIIFGVSRRFHDSDPDRLED